MWFCGVPPSKGPMSKMSPLGLTGVRDHLPPPLPASLVAGAWLMLAGRIPQLLGDCGEVSWGNFTHGYSECMVYSTLCSVQCAVCNVYWLVLSVQCSVFSVQCSVFSVQCAVCSVQFAVCSVQSAVCSLHCAVYSVQCTSHTKHFKLHTEH